MVFSDIFFFKIIKKPKKIGTMGLGLHPTLLISTLRNFKWSVFELNPGCLNPEAVG
jgi:hypothetical protein